MQRAPAPTTTDNSWLLTQGITLAVAVALVQQLAQNYRLRNSRCEAGHGIFGRATFIAAGGKKCCALFFAGPEKKKKRNVLRRIFPNSS